MKKLLCVLALAGLASTAAVAQEMGVPGEKYSVATNRFASNWFVQGSGTYGTYSIGDTPWHLYEGDYTSPGFAVALGKWFTPGIGMRLKYMGAKVKYEGQKYDASTWRFDGMFNLRNLLGGYKETNVWDLSAITGFGAANIGEGKYMAWDLGLNSSWKLSKHVAVFAEGTLMMGDRHGKWLNFYRGWASRHLTAEVGITFNIGKSNWSKAPDVDAIMALNRSQLDALNAQLADAEAENAKLRSMLAKKPKSAEVVKTVKEVQATPASVFFNLGSAKIACKKDLVNVQEIANLAKATGGKILVTGYADSKTGSSTYNQTLSEKRAKAVAEKLIEMGISSDCIETVGKGGVEHLTPYSYNRRVTVEIK